MSRSETRTDQTDPKLTRFLDASRCVGNRIESRPARCDAPFGATGTVSFALLDQAGNVFLGVSWDVFRQRTEWCPYDVLSESSLVLARAFEPPLPERSRRAEFTLETAVAHLGREVRVIRSPMRGVISPGDRGSVYHVVDDGQRLMLSVCWVRDYGGAADDWMWFSRADYRLYLSEEDDGLLAVQTTPVR